MTSSELWNRFINEKNINDCEYEAWAFGVETDTLANLVKIGQKTATTSAYVLYELENVELPKVDDYSIILDSKDNAVCIVRTKKVEVIPFYAITDAHAYKEGEGDKSLFYWQKIHQDFFEKCLNEVGLGFSVDMKVVYEEFEVVYTE